MLSLRDAPGLALRAADAACRLADLTSCPTLADWTARELLDRAYDVLCRPPPDQLPLLVSTASWLIAAAPSEFPPLLAAWVDGFCDDTDALCPVIELVSPESAASWSPSIGPDCIRWLLLEVGRSPEFDRNAMAIAVEHAACLILESPALDLALDLAVEVTLTGAFGASVSAAALLTWASKALEYVLPEGVPERLRELEVLLLE